jgi:hypothetical protein
MAYQPIFDGAFGVAVDIENGIAQDLAKLLESVFARKMMIVGWTTNGPAGSNPEIVIRGTKSQLVAWMIEFYDTSWDAESAWSDATAEGYINLVA